jgi:2-oxoglutarate dehydrogenase E1 component
VEDNNLLFKKTQRLLENRRKMVDSDQLDWSMGELLAYATLVDEGYPIRISGQDSERGTFSHRHAIIKEEKSEKEISLLDKISDDTNFNIFNSLLSEYGVLGFDYGYSITTPNTLTIWEAQFGDFSNGAQIMIDQFISCAEDKWKVQSGLVMLLPHGYEGQGAEHSSARLERYLQLCAQYNMQIVNCTTPANFFHVLRRQLRRKYRKPLIVMTPKSLLRHPKCISSLDDLSKGTFMDTIDDADVNPNDIKRIVFCSGKIYYELNEKRKKIKNQNVAIIRVEQLFPLNIDFIDKLYNKYNKSEMFWVQEEPENMGAWSFVLPKLRKYNIQLISRDESAATASGSTKDSQHKQQLIIDKVFNNIK